MKTRHVCAATGVAAAVASLLFMASLSKTNDAQAPSVAAAMLERLPVAEGAKTAFLQVDWRPDGRVLQGPPVVAAVATEPGVEGIAVTKALFAQRRLAPPRPGDEIKLIGRRGAYVLRVSEVRDWDRPAGRSGYPNAFVSPETAAGIAEEWTPFEPKSAAELAPAFASDESRNIDRSKALLIWAALLSSLSLVVNALFLSVEAKRREIAILRMAGATGGQIAARVFGEACAMSFAGVAAGAALAYAGIAAYASAHKAVFPAGFAFSSKAAAACFAAAPAAAAVSMLFALKKALSVKPLEAASVREPKRNGLGMAVSFGFGFGAFVAVEVWGASLMSAFVPSKEWPDAIVSILPAGVSAFDAEKLQGLEGVEWISELQPLQANILPLEELKGPDAARGGGGPGGRGPGGRGGRRGRAKPCRNALLLASGVFPEFRFVAGDRKSALEAVSSRDACVITEMMARARGLSTGGVLKIDGGDGLEIPLEVAGIVDLNWHMVTSRGLLRGMNGMPVNTDGPVFVSFDTLAAADRRPQQMVGMTHLWLSYKPEFLAAHGPFESGRIVEREIADALGGAYLETDEGEVRGNAVRLHSRDEIADGTFAHGNDIIGAMAKVPFVFIAVVCLGFISMIVADADARRREFAVYRAVGAGRGRIAAMLAAGAAKSALAGMAAGFAGGAFAGWLFTFGTRSVMSGWGLPPSFAVPWGAVVCGAAVALSLALAVAVPSAIAVVARRRAGEY